MKQMKTLFVKNCFTFYYIKCETAWHKLFPPFFFFCWFCEWLANMGCHFRNGRWFNIFQITKQQQPKKTPKKQKQKKQTQ